jgi:hypothetical protein
MTDGPFPASPAMGNRGQGDGKTKLLFSIYAGILLFFKQSVKPRCGRVDIVLASGNWDIKHKTRQEGVRRLNRL